ncbi:hypothetical protein GCM10025864_01330 [Luteimicrobium album]|uniref:Uncharacterized protein n=1 Tax=Luteimicrobium album TaxID=1054550 RepID=A0ABQ6HV33_9MICO|nr:hypothetical protein GCM10025864_01330 [Luteimicrobium album]
MERLLARRGLAQVLDRVVQVVPLEDARAEHGDVRRDGVRLRIPEAPPGLAQLGPERRGHRDRDTDTHLRVRPVR